MNNFDWLRQEFFTKSAAEDKKNDKEEKGESKAHEKMEKKVEEQEKKEDKKEKKASRVQAYLDKSASGKVDPVVRAANKKLFANANKKIDKAIIEGPKPLDPAIKKASQGSDLVEIAEMVGRHPGIAAGVLAAGYGIAQGANIGIGALSHHIGKDMHKDSFPAQHPYMTDLGGIAANAVLPGSAMITNTAARAGATRYADELAHRKPTSSDGVLARYSMKHPHLGPFLSMFVPGAHSVNSTLAAKSIADEAVKEKNFTYRHPYMSAFGHGLIPGAGTAYAQAAARIQEHKEKV